MGIGRKQVKAGNTAVEKLPMLYNNTATCV